MRKVLHILIVLVVGCLITSGMLYFANFNSQMVALGKSDLSSWLEVVISQSQSGTQADLIVTTLEDELNSDGDCSLREALEAANSNTSIDMCGAGEVMTDTITFAVSGTITVSSELVVDGGGPLVIDGGEVITTSGEGMTRVWTIETGSELIFTHMVVADGYLYDPAGLLNIGEITIVDCEFRNNNSNWFGGGAIGNSGKAIILNSIFEGNYAHNGGAIVNSGELTIAGSTFKDNSSESLGGAIESSGPITITGSIFIGNHAGDQTRGSGGAILAEGDLVVINSNFIENSADYFAGAIYGSKMKIISSSFIRNHAGDNPGAVYGQQSTLIYGSVFSENSSVDCGGILAGELMTITESTISGNTASELGGGLCSSNHSLVISGTIITGNNSTKGGGIYADAPIRIINSTLSNNTAEAGGGIFNHDKITVVQSRISENSAMYGAGIYNNDTMTIENTDVSTNTSTVDGGGIYNLADLLIDESIINSNSARLGGGIDNQSIMTVISSSFSDNTASYGGGGISSQHNLSIANSIFSGKHTYAGGGGIYFGGSIEINNSTFITNTSSNHGGAIFGSGELRIIDSTINNNHADVSSSAIGTDGITNINNSTISGNSADSYAGGILNSGSMTITNSTISANSASNGGGIYNDSTLYLVGSTFAENQADSLGGGITTYGTLTVTKSIISDNQAEIAGGINYSGNLRIIDSTVTNNIANKFGGGVWGSGISKISFSTFSYNYAGEHNGGIHVGGTSAEISDCLIIGNSTNGSGGGIAARGTVTVTASTISGNSAGVGGGVDSDGTLVISDTEITGNSANYGGGLEFYGKTRVVGSLISENNAVYEGGGISYYPEYTEFRENKASDNLPQILAISDTTITSNTAETGAGVYIEEYAVITNSMISGNHAIAIGGGIYGDGDSNTEIKQSTIADNRSNDGAGIYSLCGVTLDDSTVSGNSATNLGGGVYREYSFPDPNCKVSVTNSTIADNSAQVGGGIYGTANNVALVNTIDGSNPTGGDCSSTIYDGGHNLDSDNSCGLMPEYGSLPGVEPVLGLLQDNGGPTWTQALLKGSPAIDAGDDTMCPPTDQRGIMRPQDGNGDGIALYDIGAYELEFRAISPTIVTISGAGEGFVGEQYTFTATVEPISTTLPVTYTWQASGQEGIVHSNGLSDTVDLIWENPGTMIITVTASNPFNSVTGTAMIEVHAQVKTIFLPYLMRSEGLTKEGVDSNLNNLERGYRKDWDYQVGVREG